MMLLTISIIEGHEKTNKQLNKTNEQKGQRTLKKYLQFTGEQFIILTLTNYD